MAACALPLDPVHHIDDRERVAGDGVNGDWLLLAGGCTLFFPAQRGSERVTVGGPNSGKGSLQLLGLTGHGHALLGRWPGGSAISLCLQHPWTRREGAQQAASEPHALVSHGRVA